MGRLFCNVSNPFQMHIFACVHPPLTFCKLKISGYETKVQEIFTRCRECIVETFMSRRFVCIVIQYSPRIGPQYATGVSLGPPDS